MGPHATPVAGRPAGTRDPGGVDLYVGGVEHAVLHLLYARFWHKVLHDLGHLTSEEPFRKYFSQGYIQAYAYTRRAAASPCRAEEVEETPEAHGGDPTYTWQGEPVNREYGKIGKSLKNVVSPDEMYDAFGADTFRVYEMCMGPLELSQPWETRAVVGAQRFLQRLWRNVIDEETGAVRRLGRRRWTPTTARIVHRTIDAVGRDYAGAGVQHRDRPADRAEQRADQARRGAPRGRGDDGAHGRAAGAAHRRGAVVAAGPRGDVTYEPFPAAGRRRCSSRRRSRASCRSRARCATGSRCRPTIGEDELRELVLACAKVVAATDGRSAHGHRAGARSWSTSSRPESLRPLARVAEALASSRVSVAIVTDSTAYLPADSSWPSTGIRVVPLHVVIGGQRVQRGRRRHHGRGRPRRCARSRR